VGKLKSQGVAPSANLFCTLANAYAQQVDFLSFYVSCSRFLFMI